MLNIALHARCIQYAKVIFYLNAPGADGTDYYRGHGTHVSGSVAGSIVAPTTSSNTGSSSSVRSCAAGTLPTCTGECLTDADCVSLGLSAPCAQNAGDMYFDNMLNCPAYSCDGNYTVYTTAERPPCGVDAPLLLPAAAGSAQEAKLAFVDIGNADGELLDTMGISDILKAVRSAGASVSATISYCCSVWLLFVTATCSGYLQPSLKYNVQAAV
jgi:hypothetical protein